jgi:hypothetical protein
MSLIARKDPWQEQLWNVSLLPAAFLPPVGQPVAAPSALGDESDRRAEQGSRLDRLGEVLLITRGRD